MRLSSHFKPHYLTLRGINLPVLPVGSCPQTDDPYFLSIVHSLVSPVLSPFYRMDSAPSFHQAPLPSSTFPSGFNVNIPTTIDPTSQPYWLDTLSMPSRPTQDDFVPQFPSAASAPAIPAVSASTPIPTPKPSKRKRLAKVSFFSLRAYPPLPDWVSNTRLVMLVTGVNVGAMERRHAETGMSLHVQDMPRANSDFLFLDSAFADKPCTYTDTSGRPVAPPNPTPAHRQSSASQGWASSGSSFDANTHYRPPTPVPTTSDPGVSLIDPGTVVHLVNSKHISRPCDLVLTVFHSLLRPLPPLVPSPPPPNFHARARASSCSVLLASLRLCPCRTIFYPPCASPRSRTTLA